MTLVIGFGGIFFILGCLGLLVGVIPAVRRRNRGWVRTNLVVTVVGIAMMVAGSIFYHPSSTATTTTASSGAATQPPAKQTQSTAPTTKEQPKPAPKPQKTWHEAGTALRIDKWIIQAGWDGQSVVFRQSLGPSGFGEKADNGYKFALVPVAIRNNSKQTDSLLFVTWHLKDEADYTYSIETMADMYLGDNSLDATSIPPGATRSGFWCSRSGTQ